MAVGGAAGAALILYIFPCWLWETGVVTESSLVPKLPNQLLPLCVHVLHGLLPSYSAKIAVHRVLYTKSLDSCTVFPPWPVSSYSRSLFRPSSPLTAQTSGYSSNDALASSPSGTCLVQMFMPILSPLVTGNPAWTVL